MSVVGDVADRKYIPAFVKFERRPIKNVAESLAQGKYVAQDVDYVIITPAYSKDELAKKASVWLGDLDMHVTNQRMPPEQADRYKRAYDAWKNGQELPLDGTPIRGWGVISPAQQETLIQMQVLTVERLSTMTDEGIRRYGMGAVDLKNKAAAWLSQLQDKGPLVMENAALKADVAHLTGSVEALTEQVAQLMAQAKGMPISTIASAILDEEPRKGKSKAA